MNELKAALMNEMEALKAASYALEAKRAALQAKKAALMNERAELLAVGSLQPPRNLELLLYLFVPQSYCDPLVGDLGELYRARVSRLGKGRPDAWYAKQVVASIWLLLRAGVVAFVLRSFVMGSIALWLSLRAGGINRTLAIIAGRTLAIIVGRRVSNAANGFLGCRLQPPVCRHGINRRRVEAGRGQN